MEAKFQFTITLQTSKTERISEHILTPQLKMMLQGKVVSS